MRGALTQAFHPPFSVKIVRGDMEVEVQDVVDQRERSEHQILLSIDDDSKVYQSHLTVERERW